MKIKVCGIRTIEEAYLAYELGAFALGFNFDPNNKYFITPYHAANIIKRMPKTLLSVGIFANASLPAIAQIKNETNINIAQLHGNETMLFCQQIKFPVIKAVRKNEELANKDFSKLFAVLVDNGHSKCLNFQFARSFSRYFPTILSGGVTFDNILTAIDYANPMAIDLCINAKRLPEMFALINKRKSA